MNSDFDALKRPMRKLITVQALFEVESNWHLEWWGMPDFTMGDARPQHKITVNFMTSDDVKEFARITGLNISTQSDSAWFPQQKHLSPVEFYYKGPPTDSRYPICIPSKGRYDAQTTGGVLDQMGVSYRFFVEETEADNYIAVLGEDKVVVMPFHDLRQGSIPARNFIWEWAKEREYKRHWTVDDNIGGFLRTNNNRRLRVYGGGFFQAMEDFVDRYENIAMAGPHHDGFIPDRSPRVTPYLLNSRIYSCILLDTNLLHRWRGRYNEDTDLSLQLLKDGYCTLLFRALLMHKGTTVGTRSGCAMKGGNTDNVYNTDDHRRAFAESLRDQHPDCVQVVWKFNRWHHQVDYSIFKNNKLQLKSGITPTASNNEYGMQLVRKSKVTQHKEVKMKHLVQNPDSVLFISIGILKTPKEIGGWKNVKDLGLSALVVYDACCSNPKESSWFAVTLKNGLKSIYDLFDAADVIVGYNSIEFIYPILRATLDPGQDRFKEWFKKSYDLFREIRMEIGSMVSLRSLIRCGGWVMLPKFERPENLVVHWKQGNKQFVITELRHSIEALVAVYNKAATIGKLDYDIRSGESGIVKVQTPTSFVPDPSQFSLQCDSIV